MNWGRRRVDGAGEEGISATGRYASNTGTQSVTLTGVSPSNATATTACGCATFFSGTIVWP